MDIPVLGIVENYSYLVCPDCGKKISVFGESHIDEIAKELNISVNTVKYHIKKALSLLREELKDYILAITALYFYLFNQ